MAHTVFASGGQRGDLQKDTDLRKEKNLAGTYPTSASKEALLVLFRNMNHVRETVVISCG